MILLALAVAPGLAISMLIYALDKYDREPLGLLLKCFFLGMASIILPLVVQSGALMLGFSESGDTIFNTAFFAYAIVGFSEELAKFLVLYLYAYPKKAFNEPFDGIVYAVMIGMGFATLENIAYVAKYGMGTGVARMFLSVPAHGAFAVLMGYYVGLAKFLPQQKDELLRKGLLVAIFFHGTYDFFLFTGNNLFFFGAALVTLFFAIRNAIRAIKKDRALSEKLHENNYFNEDDNRGQS
ncbi:RsiW-degrading membrane proteinase PrsW (M82 family) [Chitinophaga dinghuensis]|uniref:Protease PrsW n=1 Tax=Chitinophaga dinghuensis TaxID=1539050 RepID=A0A327W5J7_9BACT|nr:PrsW family glutamic-type intramembrane protease [Chitinophaga dinghuensis]RAJ83435.1 RsiW-degrading membrane proteinase PrsW (M82 family) [Chitinophaga dinghuensis]